MLRRRVEIGGAVLLTMIVVLGAPAQGVGASGVPDGYLRGSPHSLRLRPVLATLPAARRAKRSARADAVAALTRCDVRAVTAAGVSVPTSTRTAASDPAACVVVAESGGRGPRVLAGPSRLDGSDLRDARVVRRRGGHAGLSLRLNRRGAEVLAFSGAGIVDAPVAVVLDATLLGTTTLAASSDRGVVVPTAGHPIGSETAHAVADRLGQARFEEEIGLARQMTMTALARTRFSQARASIDDKSEFRSACPNPDSKETLILGCFGPDPRSKVDVISILRVDRPDLPGIMAVTAAHEMLHAAYRAQSESERRRVDRLVAGLLKSTDDPRIARALKPYGKLSRAVRLDEAHSLIGTEVRKLPRPLERYYARYFRTRSKVVDAFDGYEAVFVSIENQAKEIDAALKDLQAQLKPLGPRVDAAAQESNSLYDQITRLRSEGRIDESNRRVDDQNAAASRAADLAAQYNAIVNQYNAKVAEQNALNVRATDLYRSISPIDHAS